MDESKLWHDGDRAILYSKNLKLVRDILGWKRTRDVRVGIMADYFDQKGKLYALQIRFPMCLRNRIARRVGLPETNQRVLKEEDNAKRIQRIAKWRLKPAEKDASFAA